MNMITCDQNCRHQKDGYCALNQVTQLTGSALSKCGYYQSPNTPVPTKSKPSADQGKGLR